MCPKRKAERDGRTLEILFHPGITLPEEVTPEIAKEAAEDFYLRGDRHVEKAPFNTMGFRSSLAFQFIKSRMTLRLMEYPPSM